MQVDEPTPPLEHYEMEKMPVQLESKEEKKSEEHDDEAQSLMVPAEEEKQETKLASPKPLENPQESHCEALKNPDPEVHQTRADDEKPMMPSVVLKVDAKMSLPPILNPKTEESKDYEKSTLQISDHGYASSDKELDIYNEDLQQDLKQRYVSHLLKITREMQQQQKVIS